MGVTAFVGVMIGTLTGMISGSVSDRATFRMGRRRPFVIVGAVLVAVSLMLARSATEFALFFASYVMLQMAENIATGAYFGLLPDLVPTEKTGLASGLLSLGQFIGSLLGFVSTGYLASTGNTDLTILTEAVVILAAMFITVVMIKEKPSSRGAGKGAPIGIVQSFREMPRDLLLLTSSRFFALLGTNVLTFFSLYYVSDVLGAQDPEFLVAVLGAAVLVVAILSGVLAGFISDRIGRKGLAMFACLLGATSMVALALVSSVLGLIIAGSMLGGCMGIFMTTSIALSSDLAPAGRGGASMGISNLAMGASQAVSPAVAGIIVYLTQDISWSGRGYRPLFLSSAVYFLVSISLMLGVREKITRVTQRPAP
jgi:MFS family permease